MKLPALIFSKGMIFALGVLSIIPLSACSIFFGSIKPLEEKSSEYQILDLSKLGKDWVQLDSKNHPRSGNPGISDVAYQSRRNSSIISLSSACKTYETEKQEDLKELTRELLLGISDIELHKEEALTIHKLPALRTTIRGKIDHEDVILKTVVLQRKNCVYDLMYVSQPKHFSEDDKTFSDFVSSLHWK